MACENGGKNGGEKAKREWAGVPVPLVDLAVLLDENGGFSGFWFARVANPRKCRRWSVSGKQPHFEIRGNAALRRLRSSPYEDNEFRSIFPSTPQFQTSLLKLAYIRNDCRQCKQYNVTFFND